MQRLAQFILHAGRQRLRLGRCWWYRPRLRLAEFMLTRAPAREQLRTSLAIRLGVSRNHERYIIDLMADTLLLGACHHERYRSHFRRRRNQRCRPAAGGGTDRDLRGNGGQGLLGPAAQPAPDTEIPRRGAAEFDSRGKRRRGEGGRNGRAVRTGDLPGRRVSQRQPAADVVAGHGPGQRTVGQAACGPGERN